VNAIIQDESGYLWVGTLGGLAKFNGKEFITYSTSNGLLSNRITAFSIIDDQLYIGHENGISIKLPNEKFNSFSAGNGNVTEIIQFNHVIYVSTNGSGLYQFENDSLLKIVDSPSKIRGMTIEGDHLLLATQDGIFKMQENKSFHFDERFEDNSFSSIVEIQGIIYATTYDGSCYKIKDNRKELFIESDEFYFRKIYSSEKGVYWLNSREGVLKIDNGGIVKFTEKSGLPISDISAMYSDREGNIWFGSAGKGLLKFSGEAFSHYNQKGGLPSDLITSILQDDNMNFWLSSYDKGVIQLKQDTIISLNYPNIPVWNSIKFNNCIFFGSNLGLHEFSNGKWKVYLAEDGLPSNKITGIHLTKKGILLIATSAGMVQLKNGTIQPIHQNALELKNIRDFIEFQDETYLASPQGLKKINGESVNFSFNTALNCLESDGSKIWIGSEDGLYVFENGKITAFDLPSRIGTNYINFLIKDNQYIYVGTNNGLIEIDRKTLEYHQYGINSGLIDLETNLNSAYIDEKGDLWFGTASGLMHLDVKKRDLLLKKIAPLLNLKSVTLNFNNRPDLLIELNQHGTINLSHKENNLVFDFDGIYLTNSQAVKYSYKLDGLSEDWSPPSSNNSISFTNLSPGEYSLLVRAEHPKGFYSNKKIIHFTIASPFYQTWWFYSLGFITLILLLIALDQFRIRTIEQKNYQNNLEISNKLSRLEQQSLNASMNRHFIFNALNSIQFFINSSDKQSANRYLTRFAKLIRKNLDSSHTANGMVPLSDELERLQLYLELESMRFKDRFEFHFNVDEHVEPETLKVPAMFLQPFVENSIIHGILPLEDRKGVININVTNHLDHIRIEIVDNGIGIENSLRNKKITPGDHESHGVKITLGRIKLLQEISERSVELIGPHQINEDDSLINGTKVTFKFLKQYLE
jgi:sensor histidine kinase YesM